MAGKNSANFKSYSPVKDAALSRPKLGFKSRWEQMNLGLYTEAPNVIFFQHSFRMERADKELLPLFKEVEDWFFYSRHCKIYYNQGK